MGREHEIHFRFNLDVEKIKDFINSISTLENYSKDARFNRTIDVIARDIKVEGLRMQKLHRDVISELFKVALKNVLVLKNKYFTMWILSTALFDKALYERTHKDLRLPDWDSMINTHLNDESIVLYGERFHTLKFEIVSILNTWMSKIETLFLGDEKRKNDYFKLIIDYCSDLTTIERVFEDETYPLAQLIQEIVKNCERCNYVIKRGMNILTSLDSTVDDLIFGRFHINKVLKIINNKFEALWEKKELLKKVNMSDKGEYRNRVNDPIVSIISENEQAIIYTLYKQRHIIKAEIKLWEVLVNPIGKTVNWLGTSNYITAREEKVEHGFYLRLSRLYKLTRESINLSAVNKFMNDEALLQYYEEASRGIIKNLKKCNSELSNEKRKLFIYHLRCIFALNVRCLLTATVSYIGKSGFINIIKSSVSDIKRMQESNPKLNHLLEMIAFSEKTVLLLEDRKAKLIIFLKNIDFIAQCAWMDCSIYKFSTNHIIKKINKFIGYFGLYLPGSISLVEGDSIFLSYMRRVFAIRTVKRYTNIISVKTPSEAFCAGVLYESLDTSIVSRRYVASLLEEHKSYLEEDEDHIILFNNLESLAPDWVPSWIQDKWQTARDTITFTVMLLFFGAIVRDGIITISR